MLLYKAKVRLLGSLNNEVSKTMLTAAEIAVLQRMHGRDAVVDVKKIGEAKKRTDRSERHRLASTYVRGPSADGKSSLEGETFLDSVLGVGNPLPQEYVAAPEPEGDELSPAEAQDAEEVVLDDAAPEPEPESDEPIVHTRVPKTRAASVKVTPGIPDDELTA